MDDHRLWDLLGRSPRPMAPPFFAAKVARQIEPQERRPHAWLSPLFRWLAPAVIAALVVVAVLPRSASELPAPDHLTALDLLEIVSPEDHEVLTQAGWPYINNGALTASL